MLLTLSTRPPRTRDDAHRGAPSSLPGSWRDSAISQLDAIAAANDRRAASRLRIQAAGFALLGVVALLLSVWWSRSAREAPRAAPTAAVRGAVTVAPSTGGMAPAVRGEPPLAAAPVLQASAAATPPAIVASAARPPPPRARAAVAASPGRVAREPAPAVAAERERDSTPPEAPPPRAAPAADGAVRTAAPPAEAPRQDVSARCAGGGFLAVALCEARECRKREHQADAVCVRLRELEQARTRLDADR